MKVGGLLLGLAVVMGAAAVAAQGDTDRVTVPLSDPSQPALVTVSLVHGSITVRGTNRKDVLVTANAEAERPRRRVDPDAEGLRRIPQAAGYRITEEANRVRVSSDGPNRTIHFEIEVPSRTNLKLSTVNSGEILVENVEGELEVGNTNGGITLNGVAGAVTAGTVNGGGPEFELRTFNSNVYVRRGK